ncbi:MAG: hypothetical protein PWQ88_1080 [Candidatus Methanomethylophilaceae archaeon]|nr:hypothetical protein [Candidatus Methanomethylophilaceae archaeon]
MGCTVVENNILEIIRKRSSVRTYADRPLDPEDERQINELLRISNELSGPFGNIPRLELVPVNREKMKTGTYGFVKNYQGLIVGICRNFREEIIDLGYRLEELVLKLTELEIGTCWMAGGLKKSPLQSMIQLKDEEMIAAVVSYGYPEKKRLMEKAIKMLIRSNTRKAWGELFFKGDFSHPIENDDCPQISLCLEAVRLAPSASNRQPWRVVLSDGAAHLYLQHTPAFQSERLGHDIQYLDIGIAMCHLQLVCQELGEGGEWYLEDPNIELPNDHIEYIATFRTKQ